MHLNEFADPKEYIPTAPDAEDFQQQLLPIWLDRSADELAPPTLSNRRQPPSKPGQLPDAASIRSRVGGVQLRSRRGAIRRVLAMKTCVQLL